MRQILLRAGQVSLLMLVAFSIYLFHEDLAGLRFPKPSFLEPTGPNSSQNATDGRPKEATTVPSPTPSPTIPQESSSKGSNHASPPIATVLTPANRTAYIKAIMDPDATDLPRLACPKATELSARYEYLKKTNNSSSDSNQIQYFFALNLRQVLPLLPRLLGSIIEVIRFLGPEHCALSIVEGNSQDGTAEVLAALKDHLVNTTLNTTYYFQSSPINPTKGDRIAKLAKLRNMALEPLLTTSPLSPKSTNTPTKVIFLNDVAACPTDILELIHQHTRLQADMVCAMDWTYVGPDPTFYDVWVARTMSGESFFRIPEDGSWDYAWNLFWNDPIARQRYQSKKPFQVYSCWNGGVVFGAGVLFPDGGDDKKGVRFRAAKKVIESGKEREGEEGECHQGEPQLFCKDLWVRGNGKIAVVPSVNFEYSDKDGGRIKELKGYTSKSVVGGGGDDDKIDWVLDPPEKVKCMPGPGYKNQFFEPWNITVV